MDENLRSLLKKDLPNIDVVDITKLSPDREYENSRGIDSFGRKFIILKVIFVHANKFVEYRYDIIHQKYEMNPKCWKITHIPRTISLFEKDDMLSPYQLNFINLLLDAKGVKTCPEHFYHLGLKRSHTCTIPLFILNSSRVHV